MERIALYNDSMQNWKKYELPKAQYEKLLPLRNVDIFAEAELEDKQLARKQKMLEFGGVS